MATGKEIITCAKKYLGEGSTRFCKAYGVPADTAWCVIFVWYVFKECGASKLFYDGKKTAYVPTAQEWLAKNCKKVSVKDAKEGDVVVFTWGAGRRDHIGFVVKKLSDTSIQSIEGNTGGSKVCLKTRYSANIYGIYRPNYTTAVVKKKSIDEIAKEVLAGKWGNGTERKTKLEKAGYSYNAVQAKVNELSKPKKVTYKVVEKDGMKIRAKASTSAKVIGTIAYGKKFVSSKQSGDWAYYDTKKGWVCIKQGKTTYLTKG